MVDSEQLPTRKLPKFFFAVLAITACLFVFSSLSDAVAQSGKVYQKASSQHKGITPLLAPPLVGMRIYWFSISTSGYGSPPISMISSTATGAQTDASGNVYVLTDAQGNFNISAWRSCPTPNASMYVLARQGNPGGTGQNNPYAGLAVIIPTVCGVGWSVDLTETTTIAAAYALSSFATVSTDSFATNSNSIAALQSAVAYASALINSTNGVVPNGSSWQTTLNTLGDMIEACVNSASACPTLF